MKGELRSDTDLWGVGVACLGTVYIVCGKDRIHSSISYGVQSTLDLCMIHLNNILLADLVRR